MSIASPVPTGRPSQTKIVATIGPASSTEEQLAGLIMAGVDVFRLNMAHGHPDQQQARLTAIRAASARVGQPVAVLADLAGPKMRLNELPGGQLTLNAGQCVCFVRTDDGKPVASDKAELRDAPRLTTTYEPLLDELAPGDRVMLADGTVSLVVEEVAAGYACCRVTQPGLIRSRQGVNLPGVKLSAPAMSDEDRTNAVWAAQNGIDFVGLSFVRRPDEVRELKDILRQHGSDAQVIAKIEKPEALERLAEIIAAADGIMVARGDLGVEIDVAQVAVVQKEIIAACNRARKPVIVATQMLESMTHSRLPTRAEVTDVANAILDGTDACMLSGETAIGDYPREAVEMMHRIALATEAKGQGRCVVAEPSCGASGRNPITEATALAAGRLAEQLGAKLVVVVTASGATALTIAKNRCGVPTVGVSDSPGVLRRMCLYWGVIPLAGAPTNGPRAVLEHATAWGRAAGLLAAGDRVVMIAGTGLAVTAHNMIVVDQLT